MELDGGNDTCGSESCVKDQRRKSGGGGDDGGGG